MKAGSCIADNTFNLFAVITQCMDVIALLPGSRAPALG